MLRSLVEGARLPAAAGLSSALFTVGLALAPSTAGAVVVDPTHAYIQSITYGGSGCPQGTVGQSISNDRETFTLIFDQYIARLGPGIAVPENRKNCQVLLRIAAPVGFAFAVTGLQQRGYVQGDQGVTGSVSATAEVVDGNPGDLFASPDATFAGPVSRDYLNEASFGPVKWSACGGPSILRIDTAVALENVGGSPTAQGMLSMDSIDGRMEQGVNVVWRKCNGGHDDTLGTTFIESVSYGGTGCPQGSVAQAINPTRDTFVLVFDQYVASTGAGVPITESRKNCQLNVNIRQPAGWASRLVGVDYDGFARLPAGAEASLTTVAYVQGVPTQNAAQDVFSGPLSEDYELTQDVMQGTSQWTSCADVDRVLPINLSTGIQIVAPASSAAAATVDTFRTRVVWRSCGKH